MATLLAVVLLARPASAEVAFKQAKTAITANASATSISATWNTSTRSGSLLVACLSVTGNVTVTPPAGWATLISGQKSSNNGTATTAYMYYIENASAQSGSGSFTWTGGRAATLIVSEYYGALTSGANSSASSNGTSGSTTVSAGTAGYTALTDTFAVACGGQASTNANLNSSAPTNSFTFQASAGAPGIGLTAALATKRVTTVGSPTTSFTSNIDAAAAGTIAVFLPAPVTTKYWVGTTSNCNLGTNWASFDGGPPGTDAPSASQSIVFNGSSSTSCSFSGDMSVAGMTIDTGYTGAINGGANRLTVAGDFAFNSNSATFTAPSGRFEVRGAFSKTGTGTFNHNSGTVALTSTTSKDLTTTGGVTFYNLSINDGLIGYWQLDDTSGTDLSGKALNLTVTGPPTVTADVPSFGMPDSGSWSFTGTQNGSVSVASGGYPNDEQPMSAGFWAKGCDTSTSGSYTALYTGNSNTGGYMVRFTSNASNSSCTVGLYLASGSGVSTLTTIPWDTSGWHHVFWTFDGTVANGGTKRFTFYVDGVQKGSTTATTPIGGLVKYVHIGRRCVSGDPCALWSEPLSGMQLDEVRIYNHALSARDVMDLGKTGRPASAIATHTLVGDMTVSNNLVLLSGALNTGTNRTISIGGNLYNYGGLMSATSGTVVLNGGAGTHDILANRQPFWNLTVSTSGTWTIQDRLHGDGTLGITSGTLNQASSSYYIHAANINKTGGTLNLTGSYLVLDAAGTAQTISMDSMTAGNVRVESPREASLKGYWKLDDGIGGTAVDESGMGNTGTLTNAPMWLTTGCASALSFDNAGCASFDGTDDYVALGTSNIPALNASKTISLWVYYAANQATKDFISLVNGTSSVQVGFTSTSGTIGVWGSGGSAAPLVATTSAPGTGAWHHVVYTYDGTTHKLYVDNGLYGGVRTSTAAADAGAVATMTLASKAGSSEYFAGVLDDVRVYNTALDANQVAALYAGSYPIGNTSAVFTAGGTLTLPGTLTVDSGVFGGGTANVSVAGLVRVRAGEYRLGSGTHTLGGGLTVDRYGKLSGASATGVIVLPSGGTLKMNGTLQTTSGSSSGPTIQASSGTYTFNVGTSGEAPAAAPVIDVNGLKVMGLGANGMNVNPSNDAAVTPTWTRLENASFIGSAGAAVGSTLLRIYAPSGVIAANACTFTNMASSTYNVKMVGDGTGAPSVILFGDSSCTNGSGQTVECEAWDSDTDTLNDARGAEVVQWAAITAKTDTPGAIQGFPTPAFDWTTFSWYATYAVYRDVDGASNDKIYVRDQSGADKGYSFAVAQTTYGDVVGGVRFNTVAGTPNRHYVYFGTSNGYIYRLQDTGAALQFDASGTWSAPVKPSDVSAVTSPLVIDGTYIYFGCKNAAGNPRICQIAESNGTHAAGSPAIAGAVISSAPALLGTDLFMGTSNIVYKAVAGLTTSTNTCPIDAIAGRVTIAAGKVFVGDNSGKLCAITAATNTEAWNQRDTATHGTCTSGGGCAIKGSPYYDYGLGRIYYGDDDGHIYVRNSDGTSIGGSFPFKPNNTSEPFRNALFFRRGVIVAGSDSGSVFFINQNSDGNNTAQVIRTYFFGASVSGIGFDPTAGVNRYLVGTSDGKLYVIPEVTDPDAYP